MPKKRFEHNKRTSIHFVAITAALQVLLTLLAYVIYETWVAAFGPGWVALEIVLLLFSVTFLTATLLAYRYRNLFVRTYYRIGAYSFACIGPLFGGCILFVILENMPIVAAMLPPSTIGLISLGAGALLAMYGIWESGRAQIIRVTVTLPHLPERWRGKTLAFVSDIHLGDVRGRHFAKKVAKKIQSIAPEAVLIGGDVYDGIRSYADELVEPLKSIAAPRGVFFASGNHEYLRDSDQFLEAIEGASMRILDNEVVDMDGIQLMGVDWSETSRRDTFQTALRSMPIKSDAPSILIKHVPDNLDIAEAHGISLTLSGHTHKGQFWPLSHITHYLFKGYDYGLKPLGTMMVYTSSGVGTWGPPFRLGTRSEIVAVTLH